MVTDLENYSTTTITAQTTTQEGSVFVADRDNHDGVMLEVGPFTLNSGSGTVTPVLLYSTTADGTYTELGAGDPLSATDSTIRRVTFVGTLFWLTGFYKFQARVDSGTPNYTITAKIFSGYDGRR